jgi:arylsulfatase A-like enzyme
MKPNIIQIVADDLGFGDIGYFNGGVTRTPNIDALFATGARFDPAYAASPVCAPSRAALLTGRYPHRTGAIDTLEGRGLDRLSLGERTLADALRAGGYRTGLVGKWHNGALDPRYHPNRRGFDTFVGFRGGWMDYYDWRIFSNDAECASDGRYLTDVWADEAVRFIQSAGEQPYYLLLAFNAPHFPLQAPADLVERYRTELLVTEDVATIYAMVEIMDRAIGALRDAVDASGRAADTVIVFTSDNGPDLAGARARPNRDLRGRKGLAYEGGIRVPFVLNWPAKIQAGRDVGRLLHFVDVAPTLLQAAGVAPHPQSKPFDGVSVLADLEGRTTPDTARHWQPRFWQWNRYTPVERCNAAVREGDWKLVCPPIPEAMRVSPEDLTIDNELKYHPERHPDITPGEPPRTVPPPLPAELYDLASDPAERTDLAAAQPALRERMQRMLDDWFADVDADRRGLADRTL